MPDQAYAMNGGDGEESYSNNSSYQKGALETAKEMIRAGISTKLDIKNVPKAIRIADFGCSTGPNTFLAVEIIVDAIQKKYEKELAESKVLGFQVFFNDQTFNDFNTLFASLPLARKYYAAGVPGSFYARQFPEASLHFAYSSCTLNWLSQVPKEVKDPSSPAWNKGRVMYYGDNMQVFNAYALQFANDFGTFLKARAKELASGGLMALLVPTVPDPETGFTTVNLPSMELLGSCLIHLSKKGLFEEEKVDTFNFPLYYTYPSELKRLIERNQDFSLERMELLNNPSKHKTNPDPKAFAFTMRAVFEALLKNHFGGGTLMEELFKLYERKVAETQLLSNPDEKSMMTFVLLKRKMDMI